jgi:ABC-type molybdate transport system permease subunit
MTLILYCVVSALGLAGLLHFSWWAAVVGVCVVALIFIAEDVRDTIGHGNRYYWDVAKTTSSLIIASVCSPVAFLAGRLTAFAWGL